MRYTLYPRFFVRDAGTQIQVIAKAETPEDAEQYTPEHGWQEYHALLSPHRGEQAVGGHTMGLSVEGDA